MCSSLNFPHPTTTVDDLEDLYKLYGVDRSVVLDLAAYLSFFHSCSLIFLIPEIILEILAELGLSLTQLLPNFLRHLVAFLVKARKEGLVFGLSEFCQFVLVKRNNKTPGTFLVSPHPGRHKWREQFFFFRMDRASMGNFDFSQLSRRWVENIAPSGSSPMSDEIRGLIRVLRRGRSNWSTFDRTRIQTVSALPVGTGKALLLEKSEDEAGHSREVAGTPSAQTQSSDRLNRQLSPLISIHDSDEEDVLEENRPPVSLSPGSDDETVVVIRKRCRSSEGSLPDDSSFAAQSDLISLAGRMRSAGCRLPSLASSVKREAYAKVAVASSKVMEAFNEYVVTMEDHVAASRNDKEIEIIGSEIQRLSKELEATKREGREDAENIEALTEDWKRVHLENKALESQMVAQRARIVALEVLESLKDRWARKKNETSAEIRLQEVVANIDLLIELKDGGLTVDAELARLKEMERDCADLLASATVPDWSISELDLPQVSDDSVDQVGGNMTSRISNSRDSDRVQTRTGVANAELLREETRIPWFSSHGTKDPEGETSVARVQSSSPTGSDGRDRPPKKAKTNGSDHRLVVPGDAAVAKQFHWQFSHLKDCPITEDPDSVANLVTNNEFAATLEKRLQDVPRSGELNEIKKVVRELKLGLKMAQDR
ncbi:hypothetical protein Bca52824_049429 [Brassica carinata]|uniref:Uncharacterized protein n=1 Tax=Brassica carinata TaxID=52824 RepID=A0A8X7RN59_BRACI|nr:hypothetical protein Bca52824_049429 [Brassica carinata]